MKIQRDKYLHFLACAAISALVSMLSFVIDSNSVEIAYSGFVAGVAAGLGKEYGDFTCSGNKWDNFDIIADVLGALVGSSLILILHLIIH